MFRIVFFFLCLMVISCNSSKDLVKHNSRFISKELKVSLSKMIALLMHAENSQDTISIQILVSPKYIYPQILSRNCDAGEYYSFKEDFNGVQIPVYINSKSFEPERYFNLNNLEVNSDQKDSFYNCDIYNSLFSRFSERAGNIKLEKILTNYKNSKEQIYPDEDTIFLSPYIRRVIPEPTDKIPQSEN